MAVMLAVLTAMGGMTWAPPSETLTLVAVAFVVATAVTLVRGEALVAAVVAGLVVCGMALEGGASMGTAALLLAGVVATAELAAVAVRLATPVERDPRADVGRAAGAAGVAALLFAAMTFLVGLPGPSGIVATAMGAAGCVLLALGIAWGAGAGQRTS